VTPLSQRVGDSENDRPAHFVHPALFVRKSEISTTKAVRTNLATVAVPKAAVQVPAASPYGLV